MELGLRLNQTNSGSNNPIGIDLGILRFATLSTGEEVSSPRPYKQLEKKSELVLADRFFPSSKLCPCCGHKKDKLPLSMRVYDCENCDWIADRDYSASLNLRLVS